MLKTIIDLITKKVLAQFDQDGDGDFDRTDGLILAKKRVNDLFDFVIEKITGKSKEDQEKILAEFKDDINNI